MNNKEIAGIFSRIADALEIKDENVFRIRAYRVAAQNISSLPIELEDIYKQNNDLPEKIPGIGEDLKGKIIEMIKTGRLKYYNELMKEFPAGFFELLSLSGLGPKKVKKLHDELGIRNIDDLEKACKAGKITPLEGMGIKTQEKLLEAIAHYRKSEGRMLLPLADYYANRIIAYLGQNNNFKKIQKAGSLRRGKETVADIDILATAKDNSKAMDYFVKYPEVDTIIAKGPTKSSISLHEGPQVDLRIIDESCFGAALVYFTGSKQHNVEIRKIAKAKGYKVSEYGVFSISKTGKEKMIAGKREEEVYAKLGMQYIPPELREAQGEVEASLKGTLPKNLVKLEDIKGDLHMHTTATDGRASIEDMIGHAKEKGYEYIAITDHSKYARVAGGLNEDELLRHAEKIRKVAQKFKDIKVLVGVEMDILQDGKPDLKDSSLKELDIVIAAVHSFFNLDKEKQTGRILKAMDSKYVNILAHPSARLIASRIPIQIDLDKIFKKAVENNIFLEINTHGERIDLNDVNARRANQLGARFSINTDAHDTLQLDAVIYGVVTARRGWIEKEHVINTYSFEKLIKILKR